MGNAAVALAVLGFAVGTVFRLWILLPILALLLLGSIAFSIVSGFSFRDTALMIMTAQALVQGGYFLGLVIRALFCAAYRMRPIH